MQAQRFRTAYSICQCGHKSSIMRITRVLNRLSMRAFTAEN
jgi:hypothetical protein